MDSFPKSVQCSFSALPAPADVVLFPLALFKIDPRLWLWWFFRENILWWSFWQDFPLLNFCKSRKGFFRKVIKTLNHIKFKHCLWFWVCFLKLLNFSLTWGPRSKLALFSMTPSTKIAKCFSHIFQDVFDLLNFEFKFLSISGHFSKFIDVELFYY